MRATPDEAEEPVASSQQATPQSSPESRQPGETITGVNGLTVELPAGLTRAMLGDRDIEVLAVQVMLDRSRHSPGVIDGYIGDNVIRAIRAYRKTADLSEGEAIDAELLRALLDEQGGDVFRTYTITERDLRYPFKQVPEDLADQAELERVGYETPLEMLAERFHMDQDFLAALNPDVDFGKAGTRIAIVSHGDEQLAGDIVRIEVRKASNSVVALARDGTVLASYPATIGSTDFPSPSGTMQVVGVAPRPNYTFDSSKQDWGPDHSFVIPPGPNNPVGGTWIDLGKEGYGIHGSPDPQLIGKIASHGCVRLTNWDAAELARAVEKGVEVAFI